MLSIGLAADAEGNVIDVQYGGPAYNAGIGPGMKITAVNGQQYSTDEISNAVKEAESSTAPIELLISNSSEYKTYSINYHGGLRNPHIERDSSRPDYLSEILGAHSK
jgi:predicted metalloprotease with PDZ domain